MPPKALLGVTGPNLLSNAGGSGCIINCLHLPCSKEGKLAAEEAIPYFAPPTFTSEFDMLTIGRTSAAAISNAVASPFPFTEELEHVTVTLK